MGDFSLVDDSWSAPYLAKSPVIDGDLGEWQSLPAMILGLAPDEVVYLKDWKPVRGNYLGSSWNGPLDCSAKGWLGWNQDALFFAMEVYDDAFVSPPRNPDDLWKNDSIEIALDPLFDRTKDGFSEDDQEYWFALIGTNAVSFCARGERMEQQADFPARAKRQPRGWSLEMAIPWSELKIQPQLGRKMGFTWLVNDTDTGTELTWLEWTQGLGGHRDASAFGAISLAAEGTNPDQGKEGNLRALAESPPTQEGVQDIETLIWLGHTYAFFGKTELAEQVYRAVLSESEDEALRRSVQLSMLQTIRAARGNTAVLMKLKEELKSAADISYCLELVREINTVSLGQGKPVEAIKQMRQIIQDHPKSEIAAEAQFCIGEDYYIAENWQKAEQSYLDALHRYPESNVAKKVRPTLAHMHHIEAGAYLAKGNKVEAIASWKKSFHYESSPFTQAELLYRIAATLAGLQKYDEAHCHLQMILKNPNGIYADWQENAAYLDASLYYQSGDYQISLQKYEALLKIARQPADKESAMAIIENTEQMPKEQAPGQNTKEQ